MSERILVRADAGVEIGSGHALRCFALAEEWLRRGAGVEWAATGLPGWMSERLEKAGIREHPLALRAGSIEDGQATAELARRLEAEWIVVDGYVFGETYLRNLKEGEGPRVLLVSDYPGAEDSPADLVLNQNLGAAPENYPGVPSGRLLLGPGYALLRSEFRLCRDWVREFPGVAEKVLVTLGGSDPGNATAGIIEALGKTGRPLKVKILLGGSHPCADEIEAGMSVPGLAMECIRDAKDMPGLMQEADLIVTAGGSTVWEACCLGLPGVVGVLAENQESNAERLDAAGLLRKVGRFSEEGAAQSARQIAALADDREARREMSQRERRLVDGYGSARVWFAMNREKIRLEDATREDARLIWELANEEGVRAMSFESSGIPWEDHLEWYGARLADEKCCFWLARDAAGEFIGQVRFESGNEGAVISVSLAPDFRGRGYGGLLIWTACRHFSERFPGPVLAWIRPENPSSVRAFEKAGFEKVSEEHLKGQPAMGYRWQPA